MKSLQGPPSYDEYLQAQFILDDFEKGTRGVDDPAVQEALDIILARVAYLETSDTGNTSFIDVTEYSIK